MCGLSYTSPCNTDLHSAQHSDVSIYLARHLLPRAVDLPVANRAQDDCAGYLASVNGVCHVGDSGYDACHRACGVCTPRNATVATVARLARRRPVGRGFRHAQRRRNPNADSLVDEGDDAALV